MKKLVLILSAIVVLVAFAVPVFAVDMYDPEQRLAKLYDEKASPVKLSGEFTFGFITPFDSEFAGVGFANAYIDFTWWPDEYNSLLFEINVAKEYNESPIIGGGSGVTFPYFELTTDIGSYFGLPIGVKNTAGISSLYTNKYEVTGHAWERTEVRTAIDPLFWKIWTDFGMVQVTVAIGIGQNTSIAAPWTGGVPVAKGAYNDFGIYAFLPAIGPAEVEAWYLAQDDPDIKGILGGSVKADGLLDGMLGIAGGFRYNLQDDSGGAGENYWGWGAGASVDFMGATLGVSANGNNTDALLDLGIDLEYAFMGDFGVYGTAGMTFAEGAPSTYLGSEFGAFVKVGGAKWTVGYLLDADENDGRNYSYSVAEVTFASKGGLFVVADIDF
jgi:hypothetical protein